MLGKLAEESYLTCVLASCVNFLRFLSVLSTVCFLTQCVLCAFLMLSKLKEGVELDLVMVQGTCPNCNAPNSSYFGDILTVKGNRVKNEVQCGDCKAKLQFDANKRQVSMLHSRTLCASHCSIQCCHTVPDLICTSHCSTQCCHTAPGLMIFACTRMTG